MARFIIKKYTMIQCNKAEYKNIKINNAYWFEANSTDDAIKRLPQNDGTYIIHILTDNGYKPFLKALIKNNNIKILNDMRESI